MTEPDYVDGARCYHSGEHREIEFEQTPEYAVRHHSCRHCGAEWSAYHSPELLAEQIGCFNAALNEVKDELVASARTNIKGILKRLG